MAAAITNLPPNVDGYRLIDLFGKGAYDNLGEPKPWSNDAHTLKILTILFLVHNSAVELCSRSWRDERGLWG